MDDDKTAAGSCTGDTLIDGPQVESRDCRIRQQILELCAVRGTEKSICPSEVARALEADEAKWRALLKPVRREAAALARAGRIDILKKGKRIGPDEIKGVIRLRMVLDGSN
ncbi:MAG: DUF3253 domain-containing protein [Pseudomonadota bacterium]